MAKESFADILSHYIKGEDLERAKVMLEKSESEFLEYEMERINVQMVPQNLSACLALRSHTSKSQKYPIADLLIRNNSPETAEYIVSVEVDRCSKFELKKKVDGNSCTAE